MKKMLSFLMVCIMVLSIAGCGEKTEMDVVVDNGATATEATETSAEDTQDAVNEELDPYAPIEGKAYEIQMTKYKKEPSPDDAVMLKFYEDKFGVDINLWNLDQNKYVELLNLRIAGGEIPDMMYLSGQAGIEQNLYEQGVLLPLDREVLDKYAPNMMAMLDKLKPGWEEYCTAADGTLIKLPDFPEQPNEQAIIWRGDWLEAVGITEVPRTLEEFETALYAFTNDDPDGNGKDDTYGASLMVLQSVFGAYGAMPYWSFGYEKSFGNVWQKNDAGQLEYAGIQPKMKEALTLLNKWYEDGVLDPEFVTGENQGGYWANSHPFFYGRIGFTGHGAIYHWMPPTSDADLGGANYKELMNIDPAIAESLVYGEPPIGPYGDKGVSGESYVSNNKGTAFSSLLADEPDKFGKLLQVLDWQYASYENYLTARYGIEGEHYTKQDVTGFDGNPYTIINITEEGQNADAYFLNGMKAFPAYFEEEGSNPSLEWKLVHNIGEEVYTNDLNSALPSETMYGAELEKLTSETYYQIITGEKPIDYFDEYVETWKSSGGDIFYEEANAK
jgi:putative aldouronate transport system substrate-binding protein